MKSVYVGNLPYATTDNELKALFEPFGTVYGARIKTDRDTGRPLGYGFVQMDDADAAKAIQALDGKELAGRNLRVNESREKSASDRPPRREFGDRPPRREFGSRPPRPAGAPGSRPPFGDRPPRREFNPDRSGAPGSRSPFGDRPPRRDYSNPGFPPNVHTDEYDGDQDDDSGDFAPSSHDDFSSGDRPQRRRTFRKPNSYGRDSRDNDRPRRPFIKNSPRKKGYRPNEDYESEE